MPDKLFEKITSGRQYRRIDVTRLEVRADDNNDMIVEGYATTFNQPYELLRYSDYVLIEQVDSGAFNDCDMSDVILQYNHEGRVFARTRNKTLELTVDGHGLKVRAHLGGTELGRQLYEEIKGGYTDRMSFGFTVKTDKREILDDYESGVTTVIRTITGIDKLYDVSAVSFPANEGTEISARSYFDGVIEELRAQAALAEEERHKEQMREEIRALLKFN